MPRKPENELTDKEKEILKFINEQIEETGSAPTLREIGQRFKFTSTGHIRYYLRKLIRKGFIKRTRKARGIIIGSRKAVSSGTARLPIVGKVPAGAPVPAIEDIEGYINIDKDIARGEMVFALRVKGDSMVGAGILDDDIVIVRKQSVSDSGDFVVADVNGEATVKKLKIAKDKIILEPANPAYEPIVTDRATIIGKVISLVRNYSTRRIS
ncbi:MAG: transcriptional repressor LexA [Elusimicrobiota bacterium]